MIAFLCLRRGVSVVIVFRNYKKDFSLPTQRCFLVLPMVLVFYITFLCLRRGVSKVSCGLDAQYCFSLPTQRCFSGALKAFAEGSLFSAYAEVFLLKELN